MADETNYNLEEPEKQEELGVPLTIVSFCIPLVGAILYFVNRTKAPKKAQTACYAALGGFVVGIIVRIATMAVSR
ncbi:MAG: hypothetical protein ABIQ31_12855 [Ferruginibacter sp.]